MSIEQATATVKAEEQTVIKCWECGREMDFDRAAWIMIYRGGHSYEPYPVCPFEHRYDDDPAEGDGRRYSG